MVDPLEPSTTETSPDPGSSENIEDSWMKLYLKLREANAFDNLDEFRDTVVYKAFSKL